MIMTDLDKRWEEFHKDLDSEGVSKASASGALEAMDAKLNQMAVKLDELNEKISEAAAPPEMPPGMDMMGGAPPMPPEAAGGMPPAGPEGAPEEMSPEEGASEDMPPEGAAPDMGGAPMPPDMGGAAPPMGGAPAGGAPPMGGAPAAGGVPSLADLGAQINGADASGQFPLMPPGLEEEEEGPTTDPTLDALQEALSMAKDPEVIRNLAEILLDYSDKLEQEEQQDMMMGGAPMGGVPAAGGVPPEALMAALGGEEQDAPVPPSDNISPELLTGAEGVAPEGMNPLLAALTASSGKTKVEELNPIAKADDEKKDEEKKDEEPKEEKDEEPKEEPKPEEKGEDMAVVVDIKPDEESQEMPAAEEPMPEGDCPIKALKENPELLSMTLGDLINAARSSSPAPEKDPNMFVHGGVPTDSVTACAGSDLMPAKKSVERSFEEDLDYFASNPFAGREDYYQPVQKAMTEEEALMTMISSIVKSYTSADMIKNVTVGDALDTISLIKSTGAPNVERRFVDTLDIIARYTDGLAGEAATEELMKSKGIDMAAVFKETEPVNKAGIGIRSAAKKKAVTQRAPETISFPETGKQTRISPDFKVPMENGPGWNEFVRYLVSRGKGYLIDEFKSSQRGHKDRYIDKEIDYDYTDLTDPNNPLIPVLRAFNIPIPQSYEDFYKDNASDLAGRITDAIGRSVPEIYNQNAGSRPYIERYFDKYGFVKDMPQSYVARENRDVDVGGTANLDDLIQMVEALEFAKSHGYRDITRPAHIPSNVDEYKEIFKHAPNRDIMQYTEEEEDDEGNVYEIPNLTSRTTTILKKILPYISQAIMTSGEYEGKYSDAINKMFGGFIDSDNPANKLSAFSKYIGQGPKTFNKLYDPRTGRLNDKFNDYETFVNMLGGNDPLGSIYKVADIHAMSRIERGEDLLKNMMLKVINGDAATLYTLPGRIIDDGTGKYSIDDSARPYYMASSDFVAQPDRSLDLDADRKKIIKAFEPMTNRMTLDKGKFNHQRSEHKPNTKAGWVPQDYNSVLSLFRQSPSYRMRMDPRYRGTGAGDWRNVRDIKDILYDEEGAPKITDENKDLLGWVNNFDNLYSEINDQLINRDQYESMYGGNEEEETKPVKMQFKPKDTYEVNNE